MARTDETLWQSVRALPGPVWLLFAGSFVNRFGSFVATFLVLYLVEQGLSAASAGLAVSAYGVGSLASALVGGWLADRLGGRATIATSMFSAAAVAMALSQADRLPAIVALAGLFGMSTELYRPASAALLADLVPPERRLAAYAGYRMAINAGFAFGPAVAGLLAERSFLWLFVGEAVTSVVLGVVALIGLPSVPRSRRTEEPPGEALRALRADPRFVLFLVASALAASVYFQSTAALPLHVRDAGLSRAVYGGLISLNGLLIVLFELPLVGVTRRFSVGPTMAVGVILTGVGFALTGVAHTVGLLVATVVVWTVGEMVVAPVMNAYVAGIAPKHLRGRYQGAYVLTYSVALVVAPAVGTRVFAWSPTALWLGCGVTALIAAALLLRSAGDPSAPRTSPSRGS
ncbi:MAG TPA: MFS transporter [Actinomycetota bacterium]|nr:MFS transporter [Actinomycetota bacterium]